MGDRRPERDEQIRRILANGTYHAAPADGQAPELLTAEQRDGDVAAWIRSRPPEVQALIRRFPPMCLVEAVPGRLLYVPAPGVIGVVASYFENGTVKVEAPGPAGEPASALCEADWLEFVWDGPISREQVAAILDG